jgi:hypothetical protein
MDYFQTQTYRQDTDSLVSLGVLNRKYIPWSSSAMRPAAVRKIINDIIINERKNVIEFGSGISTIYIASILKELGGGSFYSVEHDESWINIVLSILKKEGLENYVNIIHAPLESSRFSINNLKWYSENCLMKILECPESIDCVIIDGPMAYTKELSLSRYPALPFLVENNMLSQNCIVILDDGQRWGEKRVIKRWEKTYDFSFKQMPMLNIAFSVRGKYFHS